MFRFATGWLWYAADVALDTPIPQLELAREGKLEFLKAIFDSKDDDAARPRSTKEAEDRLLKAPPDRDGTARRLLTMMRARAAADAQRFSKGD